jgi:hypothetical protein
LPLVRRFLLHDPFIAVRARARAIYVSALPTITIENGIDYQQQFDHR